MKKLALLEFSQIEQDRLSAVLDLSTMALDEDWLIAPIQVSELLMVNVSALTQQAWKAIQQGYSGKTLVAYGENSELFSAHYRFYKKMSGTPSRQLLIELLNQYQPLNSQRQAPIAKEYFDPEQYFLSVLQRITGEQKNYCCQLGNQITLYFAPKQQSYYCAFSPTMLKSLFLSHPDKVRLQSISDAELASAIQGVPAKSLQGLLWQATIIASQGRCLENQKSSDIVHLEYWPDISQHSNVKNSLAIATFMNHNAVSMELIARYTECQLSDVIDFHNACYLQGLIDHTQAFYLHKKEVSADTRKLRKTISQGLRLRIAA
ncbi:MAG: hypothetical protein GQ582_00900 [Methyloprofundus sp.]|nr:hypothetical protein [Methyloprofundus sp.]